MGVTSGPAGTEGGDIMLPAGSLLVFLSATAQAAIPPAFYPKCLTQPVQIIADLENCHLYYHCQTSSSPMTCGDMMFNTKTQTCDWPHKVLQLRPECRKVEQIRFRSNHEFPFQRTMRMLSFYGSPSPSISPINQQHYQTNFNENYEEKFSR